MTQHVKDPALSLKQLGSLWWQGFDSWLWNLLCTAGVAKKKKNASRSLLFKFFSQIYHF